jgi:glycosyltransferase involved in cell wall biosynthesis
MLCSIIIPVFNRELLIGDTLASILKQTYINWECIVVDDNSYDNSVEVIQKFCKIDSRIKLYIRPIYLKKGANSCRNYGFKLSNGTFIQWFDSDDIMLPSMLEDKILKINQDKSDIVINRLGFFINNIDNYFIDDRNSIEPQKKNLPFEYFAGKFWFGTPQPLFCKSFLQSQKILFKTSLNRNQETELFVRLLLKDPKISYLNDVLILQRLHDNSIGGIYSSLPQSEKYLIDLPAYKMLFVSFLNTSYFTDEVKFYFIKYFNSCFNKMNFRLVQMLNLLFFCFNYKLFKSKKLAIKIFLFRFIFSFKND